MKTYWQVHSGLHYFRGSASENPCVSCGAKGSAWAYTHEAGDEEIVDEQGRAYSENFDHYVPMCKSCHRRFDSKRMWEEHPNRAILVAASSSNLKAWRERVATDPIAQQRMQEGWKRGAAIRKAQVVGDLEYLEKMRRAGLAASQKRRACSTCGRSMAPGPLGSHLKASGHSGWVEVL